MLDGIKKIFRFLIGLKNIFVFCIFDLYKIKKAKIIFFLPYYCTGGAEKVHLAIVKAVSNVPTVIIFTQNSPTKNFLPEFKKHSSVIEINTILNKKNKFINSILLKLIKYGIGNNNEVFSSNNDYFYKIIKTLPYSVKKYDLIHALAENDHREENLINSSKLITTRIVINEKCKNDLLKIYHKNNIPSVFNNNIKIIQNGVELYKINSQKKEPIVIGFIGRWSEEKRPELFLEIAKKIKIIFPRIEFIMIGTGMKSNIKLINDAGVNFLGEITDSKKLNDIYKSLSFLLITSHREGFPMVIMESMPFGVIPICTNVGGINEHIFNGENGYIVDSKNNSQIVLDFCDIIIKLISNKETIQSVSDNAMKYANENFGIDKFNLEYQKIFANYIA